MKEWLQGIRWLQVAFGLAIGLVVGAMSVRTDLTREWIRTADWSQLPSTIVGTGIPAIAGVIFATALARNSAKGLKSVELAAIEEHEQAQDERYARERALRREGWDQLHEAAVVLLPDRSSCFEFSALARAAGRRWWEENGRVAAAVVDQEVERLARDRVEWGERLRTHLPDVQVALDGLYLTHGVEVLEVVRRAVGSLAGFGADSRNWWDRDVNALIAAAALKKAKAQVEPFDTDRIKCDLISERSQLLIQLLAAMSDLQRRAPHEAADVDVEVDLTGWRRSNPFDILQESNRLIDLIEDLHLSRVRNRSAEC